MKVLIVFNHPAPYKINLFNGICKEIDIHVIFERHYAKNRDKKFYNNQDIHFKHEFLKGIPFGDENFISSGVIKHLRKNKYDLIVMNGYSTFCEIKTIKYLNKHHIKYALYINGGLIKKESSFKKRIKTKLISSASMYFSPSLIADEYLLYYGAKKENIHHYPYSTIFENEIVRKELNENEINLNKKKYALPKGPLYISIGQFIPRKNNLLLLESWRDAKINGNLLLIGGGKEKKKYAAFIKNNDINNVLIHDFVSHNDLLNIIRSCTALVFITKEDIYGHVVNEALSQAIPVICSNRTVAGLSLIKNGINGFIVPLEKSKIIDALKNVTTIKKENLLKQSFVSSVEEMVSAHIKLFKEIGKL